MRKAGKNFIHLVLLSFQKLNCENLFFFALREVLQEDAQGHLQRLQDDEAYKAKRRRLELYLALNNYI